MMWMKRLTLLLAGLSLSLILILAVVLLVLDDADYRHILVWSADNFLDSELVISGPMSIGYSGGILFSAEGIQLRAHDGRYSLETGSFATNFYPASIFSGVLWVENLTLDEFRLKITESEGKEEPLVFSLPPIIIARGAVNHLQVEYQETSPGTLHSFSLDKLLITAVNNEGPVTIQANGFLEGLGFRLNGMLPPLGSLNAGSAPKPVKINFDSENITASLEGKIANLVNGKGMDLALKISIREMQEYIEIFADGIPALGKLDATAILRGNYKAPRLDDIDLHVRRGDGFNLAASGSVSDIRTGEGTHLRIAGQSDNPAVLSWALFKEQDRLSSASASLVLREENSRYLVDDLEVTATTPEGLKIMLGGSDEIYRSGHKLSKGDAGFTVKISAPGTSAFKILGRADFPDFGSVTGSAALAVSPDEVGLYGLDVTIGSSRGSYASLVGDIGNIMLNDGSISGDTDLKVKLHTTDFEKLGKRLGYEWPNLGEAGLTGDLGIRKTELRLDNARLNLGDPKQPAIRANGSLATELNKGSTIKLELDMAVADLIAATSNNTPDYLGHLQGTVNISDVDGDWGIENIRLSSSQTDLYDIKLNGHYDDLKNFDKGNITASLVINDMAALGDAFGEDLSNYGAWRSKGVFTSSVGKISYRGSASLGASTSRMELDGFLKDGKPHFAGKIDIPVLYLADFGISGRQTVPATRAVEAATGNGHVFSREPLKTAFLNDFNLELDLAANEVKGDELAIDSLQAHISIQDGHLHVSPFRMVFEKGESMVSIDVLDGEVPAYQVKITADDLQLGPLLAQLQSEVPLRGYSNLNFNLTATGRSPHELASSLGGTFSIGLENVRIPGKYIEFLSADVLGWALTKSIARESYVNLNCVVMSFESKKGLVTSRAILADGPRLSLDGRINMNLGDETLDIVLVPKQKKKIFSSISPVKIRGPLNDPVVEAISAEVALQEIGKLALLPGVFIPVKAIEKLWRLLDDGDKTGEGCAVLEALSKAAMKKLKK